MSSARPQIAEGASPRICAFGREARDVSQSAMQNLIELESEIVTSALTAAAMRLERAAKAENIVDLCSSRPTSGATRDRLVDEATRAVEIFKVAVARCGRSYHYMTRCFETAGEELPKVKTTRARKRSAWSQGRTCCQHAGHVPARSPPDVESPTPTDRDSNVPLIAPSPEGAFFVIRRPCRPPTAARQWFFNSFRPAWSKDPAQSSTVSCQRMPVRALEHPVISRRGIEKLPGIPMPGGR